MELVSDGSRLVMPAEIASIFHSAPTDTPVIEWVKILPVNPIASLGDSLIVEFFLSPNPLEFIRLRDVMLETEGVFEKLDGGKLVEAGADAAATAPTDKGKCGYAGNLLYTQWKNGEVLLQERCIQNSNNLLHVEGNVKTLLFHDTTTAEAELPMQGFFLDTPGQYDKLGMTVATTDEYNAGAVKRYALLGKSATVRLIGPLMTSLVDQHKCLIPNVSMRVKLMKNDQKHILITSAANTYRYRLTKARLHVPRVRLSVPAALAFETRLRKEKARYQVERTTNSYLSVPAGTSSISIDGIYSGKPPFLFCRSGGGGGCAHRAAEYHILRLLRRCANAH